MTFICEDTSHEDAIHTHTHTRTRATPSTHQPTTQSTYRGAGLAGENCSSLGLVHVEVLEVGLVDLPGQCLLVGYLGVFNLPVPRHHLRL